MHLPFSRHLLTPLFSGVTAGEPIDENIQSSVPPTAGRASIKQQTSTLIIMQEQHYTIDTNYYLNLLLSAIPLCQSKF